MPKRWAAGKKKIRRPESLLCKESVLKNVTLGVGEVIKAVMQESFPQQQGSCGLRWY